MRLVCAAVAVLALGAAPGTAHAVTVSVAPDAVNVQAGEHATVHVLVTNDTSSPIEQVQSRALAAGASGIRVVARDAGARIVHPGDGPRFIVDVHVDVVLRSDRTVTLLVRYRKNGHPGRVGASLKVPPPP